MLCWFGYSEKMSCKMEKHSCVSSTCLCSGYVTVASSAVRTKQEKRDSPGPCLPLLVNTWPNLNVPD